MGDLKAWVSDKLMSLLGYSRPTVVQYVIGLSKTTSSPSDFLGKLVDIGLSATSETRAFAEEIFAKVPRKASGINLYQKREREAALLVKKQKTYALLEADDDDHDVGGSSGNGSYVPASSPPRKEDTHKKRFRKKADNQEDEDEDDEVVVNREEERRVKRRTSQDEDNDSESDEERLRDQREREELEHKIKERDAAATRKLAEPKPTKREEEEAVRRSNALEEDGIDTLRKVSRQEYLKKREQKKLEELRDDIEDEQYLFDGVKLSEAEYREMRYKKEIYNLFKKWSEEADNTDEGIKGG